MVKSKTSRWKYPLNEEIGGALYLVYLRPNQAYAVMWGGIADGSVLNIYTDRADAEARIDDLLRPSNPGNPGHNPGNPGNPGSEADETAAHELELWIDNNERLYRQKQFVFANLTRKMAAGKYDPSRAPAAFTFLTETAAKDYMGEMDQEGDWYEIFNKPTRELLARSLVEEFEARYKTGELNQYIPKKYRGRQ